MEDAIEALADHVIETKLEDIPSSAIRAAKTYILDTIGVGLAGSIGPYVEELVSTFGNSVIDPEKFRQGHWSEHPTITWKGGLIEWLSDT